MDYICDLMMSQLALLLDKNCKLDSFLYKQGTVLAE